MRKSKKKLTSKFECTIPAPPSKVYDAWLNPKIPGNPWNVADKLILMFVARCRSFPFSASNRQFHVLLRLGKRSVIHDYPNSCLTRHKTPDPLQKNAQTQAGS